MARETISEIRINPRTVRIGYQVYPLANIARVQIVRVVRSGRLATLYPVKEAAVLLVLFAVAAAAITAGVPALDLGDDELATQLVTGAAALFGVRIGYLLLLLLYRLLRRRRYALLLEASGTQYTSLTGTDRDELHRVAGAIVSAIENPPAQEQIVHLHGDLVLGNQTKQTGSNSRMTINN